jgi:tRNA dimethylallyltransferase
MTELSKPLIVIVGPTAVGKTELAIRLAETVRGEIISADSRLFYRGMDIGTAKPTREELAQIPHHLIDVTTPDQEWSLALYLSRTLEVIKEIHQRGSLPFLVGGTGQYIQAIVDGWELPKTKPNSALREILNRWADEVGIDGMRARLAVLDPDAAEGIDGPNLRRIIRALEVILTSGRRFSHQRCKTGSPYRILQIGLMRPREELFQRIDQRIELMMDRGLEAEVKSLLDAGYKPESSAMSAIGYKQMAAYLSGESTLEEAISQMKSKTRKYVRQQANWFSVNDPNIIWFAASADPFVEILNEIQHFLS